MRWNRVGWKRLLLLLLLLFWGGETCFGFNQWCDDAEMRERSLPPGHFSFSFSTAISLGSLEMVFSTDTIVSSLATASGNRQQHPLFFRKPNTMVLYIPPVFALIDNIFTFFLISVSFIAGGVGNYFSRRL